MNKFIRKVLLKIVIIFSSFFNNKEKLHLQILYYLQMGKKLDLKNPQTLNEKLQWLKLYDRKPEYTRMVDKILAKDYVKNIIGEEYIIPTLAVWDKVEDIDVSNLPKGFVIKTNHSGGNSGVIICPDKNKLDIKQVKKHMKKSLKSDIYTMLREWPYKNIERKIFAEKLLGTGNNEIVDYKFYCFDGYVESVLLCIDRQIGDPKFYFFDKDWNLKRHNKRGKEAPNDFTLPKPENMDRMFEIASLLSKGLPYARVDLYNVEGHIYFGEITLYPASGFDYNRLYEADLYFGSLVKLSK